jgi:hypothetical protein
MIKLSTIRVSVLTSCLLASVYGSSAFACLPAEPGCTGALDTTANSTTNVTINLNGNGLDKLNQLTSVVVPTSQVNSGNVTSVSNVYSPVANSLTATSTAIGNVVSLNLDQKTTAVSNQFNSGAISSLSNVTEVGAGSKVKDSINLSSTAIGNVFNASLNLDASGKPGSLAAAIAQCNTGAISSVTNYSRIDPMSIAASSTAIGNVASISNTGVKITVK